MAREKLESNIVDKPWYGCATFGKLIKDSEVSYYYDGVTEFSERDKQLLAGLVYHKSTRRNGYIHKGDFAIVPYHGYFGDGALVISHCNGNRVWFNYYLEEPYLTWKETMKRGRKL